MKSIVIYILTIILAVSSGCGNLQKVDRNNIKFKDPVETVEGKLKVMNNLLDKILPVNGEMQNYFFDSDSNLYVNSQSLGQVASLSIGKVKMFQNFSINEQEEFISILLFLNRNYLSSVFLDKSCKCYLYGYHQVDDPSFKDDRLIYLNESNRNYKTILIGREIMDKKGNLVLVGVK